jgi:DeoR/GlpR family transcriptional regulator of sugar metabolism
MESPAAFEKQTTPNVTRRRRMMLDAVAEAGSAQVDELAARFRISRMTVHRDLDDLAGHGLVRKVHGGVTMRPSSLVETDIRVREHVAGHEKQALARAAVQFIEPGQAIIIDDSTTAAALLPLLPALVPLTVLTNSLGVVQALCRLHGVKVICLGGDYFSTFDAFFGLVCEQAIASLRANTLFMSSSTVFGLAAYHQEQDVVKTKRALMAIVDRRILMVGSAKFGTTALNRLAALSEFDVVLTDDGLDPRIRTELLNAGVNLHIAGEPASDMAQGAA